MDVIIKCNECENVVFFVANSAIKDGDIDFESLLCALVSEGYQINGTEIICPGCSEEES